MDSSCFRFTKAGVHFISRSPNYISKIWGLILGLYTGIYGNIYHCSIISKNKYGWGIQKLKNWKSKMVSSQVMKCDTWELFKKWRRFSPRLRPKWSLDQGLCLVNLGTVVLDILFEKVEWCYVANYNCKHCNIKVRQVMDDEQKM